MIIPIIYPSAAWFWINNDFTGARRQLQPGQRQPVNLPDYYKMNLDRKVIRQLLMKYSLPAPLKLLSPNASERRNTKLFSCSARPTKLPANGFIELDHFRISGGTGEDSTCRILIASPELCFLQAATRCTFYELVKLGFDLCCMYAPDETAEKHHLRRAVAVNTSLLNGFLSHASGIYGAVEARKALKYVRDRSNSPMETRLAMMEILPFSYGGFAIDGQQLNADVILSDAAAAIFGRRRCSCDTLWPTQKVALEYDSNQYHLTADQHDWDKRKSSALAMDGYKLLTVTAHMVSSRTEIEKTFLSLRKMLGKRTDMQRLRETVDKRRELIQFLRTI